MHKVRMVLTQSSSIDPLSIMIKSPSTK